MKNATPPNYAETPLKIILLCMLWSIKIPTIGAKRTCIRQNYHSVKIRLSFACI